ncbi:MAG: hypothetical protein K8W52_38400 [Deltaproteobacteria bacterium]|nr:hypothetical protein [Deltaproteobacteria bacterium]
MEFRRAQGPAPLVGAGSLEVRAEGLRLRGTGGASMWPTLAGVLVGVLGVIAAAIVLVSLDIELGNGSKKLALLVGMGAGIAPGVAVHGALQKRMRGASIDALIEWAGIRVLARAPGRVTLRLSSFDVGGDVEVIAHDPGAASIVDAPWPVLSC